MNVWKDILYAVQQFKILSMIFSLLLGLNFLGYLFMIIPLQSSISNLEDKMAMMGSQRVEVQVQKQAQKDLVLFEDRLFEQTDFEIFMSNLSKTAKQQGLGIPTLNYSPQGREQRGLTKMTVGFSLNGTYPKIKKILSKLESEGHLLVVDEISLSQGRLGDYLQTNLTMEVFIHENG